MPQLVMNTGANAWLSSGQPNTVQPHTTQLQVGRLSSATMRALLRFSVAALPVEAAITSAVLQLWQQGAAQPAPAQAVYRVKFTWLEDQATWNRRLAATAWIYPGGDYWTSLSATLMPLESTLPGGQYISADVTELVRLAGGETNLLIRNASESAGTARAIYDPFAGAHPPMLVIQYALPADGRQRMALGMGVGL